MASAYLRVDRRLAEVGHQPDERRVPLVDDLGEGSRARAHQHLQQCTQAEQQKKNCIAISCPGIYITLTLYKYTYIYLYVYVCVCVYIYRHLYITSWASRRVSLHHKEQQPRI